MTSIQIANAERIVALAAARAWEPPPPIDYLKFAEEHIVFSPRESQFPGPYNRRTFPYFDEILRALSPDDPCRYVTLKCSAQIGKTAMLNIFIGGTMVMDPCDFLVVHPTEENARRWSKLKLRLLLRGTPALDAIFPEKSRDGGDSVFMKEHIDGLGSILISGANSPASLSQVTMPRQAQDDLSKWEMNNAGDPETQADSRSGSIEFAKILKASTPLVMPGCRITKNFNDGSQEHPYVPCPHCQHEQVLEWENMLAELDEDAPDAAHFTCVKCGTVIEEHHRPQMLEGLKFVAHNPKAANYHRSFWIWSAYSPLYSWGRIARDWLKAKGDSAAEHVFANDKIGKAWETRGEAPPWEKLRDRANQSHYGRGTIPAGGLVLTLGIDCQADFVACQIVAWGRDFRRFVVDYIALPGHISTEGCRQKLNDLLQQTWKNEAGNRIALDVAAIDGNAWTEDVWDWARRHPRHRLMMVRGGNNDNAPRLARVKKERNDRTGRLLKWAGRFFNFNASIMKMALYRDLAKEDPLEKGGVAFPRGLDDAYFQELTAEHRKPVKKHGFTQWRWEKDPAQANEALDTMNQAEAAATKFGVRGLPDQTWNRLEADRESPPPESAQGDIEDLLGSTPVRPAAVDPRVAQRPRVRKMRIG
ncbi:terminase gpA endonuclease subunit [Reyranella sp.]|uniref:phage terminase large subunit family protein n=1 Tax=Reyranella sp. TaxID=1929291 RepID=UPI000BD48A7F|nr:terminase gpA endonuclease subunit [Reyranella sp.]OYY40510.1 MAG: terminase [Rhodospirillales bacterium 35-66-84]OYZ93127.1 MAG: terminase [Rhodospirillales bacterium 24-66-33]OZB24255.1 MAG: terminase [Rhodospirillales bacterium 39-66-50]HQS18618.1 phage terminase large subunit family protein [Reyranella sp.]HQT14836.1 phage terminase large subunit family protein [Reyranella sp.]